MRSSVSATTAYAMLVRIDAEGRGSGAPAGTEATIFYTLADGLIARAEFEPGRSPQLQGLGPARNPRAAGSPRALGP